MVDTADELDRLIRDKDIYWEFAVFGSRLMQGMDRLQPDVQRHRLGHAPHSGRRITSIDDLSDLVSDTVAEVERRAQDLYQYLCSPALAFLFGDEGADPVGVVRAADNIVDFYSGYLHLARRVRGVSAPERFRDVIELTAHLVDRPLTGVDRYISEYVGTVTLLPSLAYTSGSGQLSYEIPFDMDMDNALLARILSGLQWLRGHRVQGLKWRAISRMARTPWGERIGAKLFD